MWTRRGISLLVVTAVLAAWSAAEAAPRSAPAFEIGLLDGGTFRLIDHRGTAVVVLFWAPW